MATPETLEQLKVHFPQINEIIQAEDMRERAPEAARQFFPQNLEDLEKFACFGGFIDLATARRLLLREEVA